MPLGSLLYQGYFPSLLMLVYIFVLMRQATFLLMMKMVFRDDELVLGNASEAGNFVVDDKELVVLENISSK